MVLRVEVSEGFGWGMPYFLSFIAGACIMLLWNTKGVIPQGDFTAFSLYVPPNWGFIQHAV